MSSFSGRTREYSLISLDRFDGENLRSTVFFLSHAHSDHMKGLDSPSFQYRLRSDNRIKLYCSEITRKLLLVDDHFSFLGKHIVALAYDVPTGIVIPHPAKSEGRCAVVTLAPCGHCIGSAMVLIEGDNGTVLYTGDFRLAVGAAARMACLHTAAAGVKRIAGVYCDTTFFVPEANYICSREESEAEVVNVIRSHMSESPNGAVLIHCKAKIGYESMYTHIHKQLGFKVHVSHSDMIFYKELPDIAGCVTSFAHETPIHACCRRIQMQHTESEEAVDRDPTANGLWCPALKGHDASSLLVIQLSTMWFVHSNRSSTRSLSIRLSHNYVRVCYSFHSSAIEVADFVSYLQPDSIHANVCPIGQTMEETNLRLRMLLRPAAALPLLPKESSWKCLSESVTLKRRFFDDADVNKNVPEIDHPRSDETGGLVLTDSQTHSATECSQSTAPTCTPEMDLWSSSSDSAHSDDDADQTVKEKEQFHIGTLPHVTNGFNGEICHAIDNQETCESADVQRTCAAAVGVTGMPESTVLRATVHEMRGSSLAAPHSGSLQQLAASSGTAATSQMNARGAASHGGGTLRVCSNNDAGEHRWPDLSPTSSEAVEVIPPSPTAKRRCIGLLFGHGKPCQK